MLFKRTLLAVFVLSSSSLYAGQVTVSGTSRVEHKPEYMSVGVTISGKCYASKADVLKAVNGAASAIKEIMNEAKELSGKAEDKIIAQPGSTENRIETVYDYETKKNVNPCKLGNWRSSNVLVLNIADTTLWSDLQDKITAVVEDYDKNAVEGEPKLQVHLGSPTAQVYPKTLKKMEDEADRKARDRATSNFHKIKKQYHLTDESIVEMSTNAPSSSSGNTRRFAMPEAAAYAMADAGGGASVFEPDFPCIHVDKTWYITMKFKSGQDSTSHN